MPAVSHDDIVQWHFVPTITNIAAPTVAQINAGDRILGITNYTMPASEAEVDVSDIDSQYDTSVVGTNKVGPIELTLKRDDTDESAGWDLFTFRDSGYLVRLPFGGSGALGVPAATDLCEVYPVIVGQKRNEGYGRNAAQKFMVSFYVHEEPSVDSVVAA
jgi:hypothetical protein